MKAPKIGKRYKVELGEADGSRQRAFAKYLGKHLNGNKWELDDGFETKKVRRHFGRAYWYTDRGAEIATYLTLVVTILTLIVTLFK